MTSRKKNILIDIIQSFPQEDFTLTTLISILNTYDKLDINEVEQALNTLNGIYQCKVHQMENDRDLTNERAHYISMNTHNEDIVETNSTDLIRTHAQYIIDHTKQI